VAFVAGRFRRLHDSLAATAMEALTAGKLPES